MRLIILLLVLLLFVLLGIAFGALNPELVGYDLGFARLDVPKGAALLVALLIGWLLGGLVAWIGLALRRSSGAGKAGRARDRKTP